MRALFLFLLLANVLFFYGQSHWREDAAPHQTLPAQPLPPGVQRLVRLDEEIPVQPAAAEDGIQLLAPLDSAQTVGDQAPPGMPENTLELDQGALKMVDTEGTETAPQPMPEAAPEAVAMLCFSLGPFVEIPRAQQAAGAIGALNLQVQRREEVERTLQGYWVYLPAQKDFAAAGAMAKKLQAAGFKDLYIMAKGAHKNAISLGLFRQQSAAERRVKQVRAKGFKPVLDTQYKEKIRYWLEFAIPANQAVTVLSVTGLATDYSETRLEQKACE